jgi:murein DD-endopeptidase MepM/ murein hydrolase activator NlpD
MIKNTRSLAALSLAVGLGACATQAPAPVVDGRVAHRPAESQPTRTPPRQSTPARATNVPDVHVVQQGDTLSGIADRYGLDMDTLMDINNLSSPDFLRLGQRLRLKGADGTPATQGSYSLTRRQQEPMPPPAPTAARQEAPSTGMTFRQHKVEAGENLFRIGLRYGVSPLDIMAENDIRTPEALKAGTVLRIPVVPAATATPREEALQTTINREAAMAKGFIWPVKGRVIERFGPKEAGVTNTGIKIQVPENTQVMAAEAGTVIYADNGLNSFGNLILLRHENGLITAYAHNSKLLVKRDARVVKGQVIALSGKTGNATTPQLHFEVRRRARAIDPMTILPPQ